MTATDYEKLSFSAGESVGELVKNAEAALQYYLEYHDKPTPGEAIFIIGNALLFQREIHYEEMRAEAARDGGDLERHTQSVLDYDWLKSLLSAAMPAPSEAEYSEAQARIQRLSGL